MLGNANSCRNYRYMFIHCLWKIKIVLFDWVIWFTRTLFEKLRILWLALVNQISFSWQRKIGQISNIRCGYTQIQTAIIFIMTKNSPASSIVNLRRATRLMTQTKFVISHDIFGNIYSKNKCTFSANYFWLKIK